ncbi:hypothetical protein [Streptomyces sp. NPDC058424]|uniref:hypothetical protein n=1 Tax=Streptomyces sp. NPDC058424 TaxID=3346491 RepID=UPI0036565A05
MAVRRTRHGRRDLAVLLLGFALAARRSELRLLDWTDLEEVEEGLAVEVWRPKVNHEGPLGVPYGSNPATCPVRAVRAWRQCLIEHGRQPVGPLFVRIDRHGRIAHPMHRHGQQIGDPSGRITGEGIGDSVPRAAARAGLTAPTELLPDLPLRWSGHSLRRGFATAASLIAADSNRKPNRDSTDSRCSASPTKSRYRLADQPGEHEFADPGDVRCGDHRLR